MSVAVGGSEMMIQGAEKGVMKAWTMGDWWRDVREVSQGLRVLVSQIPTYVCTKPFFFLVLWDVEETYEYLLRAQHVAHHLGHIAKELGRRIAVVRYAWQRFGQERSVDEV